MSIVKVSVTNQNVVISFVEYCAAISIKMYGKSAVNILVYYVFK